MTGKQHSAAAPVDNSPPEASPKEGSPWAPGSGIREELASEIAYELEGLFDVLLRTLRLEHLESEGFAMRGMILRGLALNAQLLAIVSDPIADIDEAESVLFGYERATQRADARRMEATNG